MKINYITKAILFPAFLLLAQTVIAQDVIDEDFLDNIDANAKPLWSENIPAFNLNNLPEKFANESAVVVGFKRSVSIDKKSRSGFLSKGERSLIFFENVRFKIKLNDRNAVKAFTGIYFRYNDKTDGFSAKITKPDGTVTAVSLNDAVRVESISDVPEFYKSFFDQQNGGQRSYYKVAVSDLEPGDMLEYVTTTKSKLDVLRQGYIEFAPQYEICNKSYPILFNQIIIETDDKSFFKSLSANGAPDFKKETANDPEFFKYVFTDYDRGVEKDVNFINAFQVYPLTKFQVIYANNEKIKGALIGEKGEIKTSFKKEELARKAWEDYEQVGDSFYPGYGKVQNLIDAIWIEFKRLGAKNWSEKDFINNAYYKIRNIVVNRDTYLSDKLAAYIFGSLLYQQNIKSQLVITVSSSIGKISNVLFDQEIRYVVKVGESYYFNLTDHSNPGELIETLLANEGYIIEEPSKNSSQVITPVVLPNSDFSSNVADYIINAELDTSMNLLNVKRFNKYTGLSKARNINDALKFTTYMLDDYKNYDGNSPTTYMSGPQQAEYYRSVRALQDEYEQAKKDFEKAELENEFQQKVKFKDFNITSNGRSLEDKDLAFTEEFELHGMLRKAGQKYLVNMPGLIGSQLQIKKEERERKYDINVGIPRTLSWVINLKIPEGYKVEGLQELNFAVDNEVGSFSSAATMDNGNIILTIKKVYKNALNTKDKWPLMLAFIDAAYNYSFKYILLKPKTN